MGRARGIVKGVHIVKVSTLSCTVGVPLSTLRGEAKPCESVVRTDAMSPSGPDTSMRREYKRNNRGDCWGYSAPSTDTGPADVVTASSRIFWISGRPDTIWRPLISIESSPFSSYAFFSGSEVELALSSRGLDASLSEVTKAVNSTGTSGADAIAALSSSTTQLTCAAR